MLFPSSKAVRLCLDAVIHGNDRAKFTRNGTKCIDVDDAKIAFACFEHCPDVYAALTANKKIGDALAEPVALECAVHDLPELDCSGRIRRAESSMGPTERALASTNAPFIGCQVRLVREANGAAVTSASVSGVRGCHGCLLFVVPPGT